MTTRERPEIKKKKNGDVDSKKCLGRGGEGPGAKRGKTCVGGDMSEGATDGKGEAHALRR